MELLGALIGGLGLFLLAVNMITDGLRMTAGDALRDLLGRWTRTPLRGIGAGALITGIVQSSSAVTIATIGFVNANLLTMQQALGVVYGANIGTTMTAWLVAAVGFKIKLEVFALPMIGVGMLLHLTGAGKRRSAIGFAVAGFGLFFIGIDVLKVAFEGLAAGVDLGGIGSGSGFGLLIFVGVGIFMTVVTQSSSAAIAITLTAATGGVISVPAAAATVIGANMGTTSTALFATLGATANAKRVAVAHVVFNLVTGGVALLLLPGMLWVVDHTEQLLLTDGGPAVGLALFHTFFNLLGVLLLWPFTARLAAFLEKRFVSRAEDLGKPRFLDANTVQAPLLAQDAMRLELLRVLDMARNLALGVLQHPGAIKANSDLYTAVQTLCDVIDSAAASVGRARMTLTESQPLPDILRLARRLREASVSARQVRSGELEIPQAREFVDAMRQLLVSWNFQNLAYDDAFEGQAEAIQKHYDAARSAVLDATAAGQYQPARANQILDQLHSVHRMMDQIAKAARRLQQMIQTVEDPDQPLPKIGEQGEQDVVLSDEAD